MLKNEGGGFSDGGVSGIGQLLNYLFWISLFKILNHSQITALGEFNNEKNLNSRKRSLANSKIFDKKS